MGRVHYKFFLSKSPSERYLSPVSHEIATTRDFGPSFWDICIAAATFIPLEVPQKIPSFRARSLDVCLAIDSSMVITSSTSFESYILGINPSPTP